MPKREAELQGSIMFKNTLAIIFFISSMMAFGRSPAVEPITGIDIGKYKEVDPAQDPGFNWKQGDYVQETSLITTRRPAEKALIERTRAQKKSWPTYLFLFGLITLPFALWYSIMKGLEGKENHSSTAVASTENYTNNTVDLHSEREKRKVDNDNNDIPKAS